MKVPFGTISITSESKKLISHILDSGRVSSGRYVREFEERFAQLVGAKEAVAVSSGTDADALALAILYDFGAQRGDEVIIPSLSFVATGNAVLQAGFMPVFVDIERETLNINPGLIEKAITKRTRAIMPVHLMGKPCAMAEISRLAKKYGLYVFEDAAEAHGAKYNGKNVGLLGDAGAFSLYVAHIITTIEGGIIITKRKDFAEILRSLRSHGRACKCKACILNTASGYCAKRFRNDEGTDIRFVFERVGYSAKMNELEAAVGLGSLKLYKQIIEKRKCNLNFLMKSFKKFLPALSTIFEEKDEEIGPHAFPIIVSDKARFSRDQLSDYLEKHGIETRHLFSSMPTQCAGFSFLGYKKGDFPEAEFIGCHGLHIGVHQDLNKSQLKYIMSTIEKFLLER
jgi:dTDP-4-amino-4,6-dideoxygalactose transaminase